MRTAIERTAVPAERAAEATRVLRVFREKITEEIQRVNEVLAERIDDEDHHGHASAIARCDNRRFYRETAETVKAIDRKLIEINGRAWETFVYCLSFTGVKL